MNPPVPTYGPNVAARLESLATLATTVAKDFRNGTSPSQAQHDVLVDALQGALGAVYQPGNENQNLMADFARTGAMHLFYSWGAFDYIPPEGTISYTDLAAKLDADVALISKLGRASCMVKAS